MRGLSAKSHDWTRAPGGFDICLPCGQYAHNEPTLDCPAYSADFDCDVLRGRISELEAALRDMTDKFCDFAHNSGMMIEDPESHVEVMRANALLKNS